MADELLYRRLEPEFNLATDTRVMLDALDRYAFDTQQMASQLRFSAFLTEHLSEEIVSLRRARERAADQHRRLSPLSAETR